MFLHRKLAGSFLLLARIGARIDARALVLPFLPRGTRTGAGGGRSAPSTG